MLSVFFYPFANLCPFFFAGVTVLLGKDGIIGSQLFIYIGNVPFYLFYI